MLKIKGYFLITYLFYVLNAFSQEENRYYLNYTVLLNDNSPSGLCTGGYSTNFNYVFCENEGAVTLYDGLTTNNTPFWIRTGVVVGNDEEAGHNDDASGDSPRYSHGTNVYTAYASASFTNTARTCTRTYSRKIQVTFDDPIVIKSVCFINEYDIPIGDKNIACTGDNYKVRIITEPYRNNGKGYYILQIYNKNNQWQTIPDTIPNPSGGNIDFSWDDLSTYVNYGQAIKFRTRKLLLNDDYSTSTSTNYLYVFPVFELDGSISVTSPTCYGDSPTIKIPSSTTGDYIIIIKGNYQGAQGYNYTTKNKTPVNGYYTIDNETPDANGNYNILPQGVKDSIIIEHASDTGISTPCAYKGTINIPYLAQFIIKDLSYALNVEDNNHKMVQIPTHGSTGRVNFIIDSCTTPTVNIVSGSITKVVSLTYYYFFKKKYYYYDSTYIDLPVGTHSIQVTNGQSCKSNVLTATLAEPALISYSYNATNISCDSSSISGNHSDGIITLSNLSGGIGSYSVSPSASLVNGKYILSGLSHKPRGYYVTVYDNYGSGNTTNIYVNYNSAVSMTFINDTAPSMYCLNDGKVKVVASGGTAPYNYSRINNSYSYGISNVLDGFSAGKQPVYVMDSKSCVFVDTAIIPEAPPAIAVWSEITAPVCHGNSNGSYTAIISNILGALSVSSSDPRIFSSDILVSGDTIMIKDLEASTYSINISDTYKGNNCDTTIVFEIPDKPSISITSVISPVIGKGTPTGKIGFNLSGGNYGKYSVYLLDDNYNLIDSLVDIYNYGTFDSLLGQYEDGGRIYRIDVTDSMSCSYIVDNGDYYHFKIREPKDTLNLTLSLVSGITCHGESDAIVKTIAQGGWGYYGYSKDISGIYSTDEIYSGLTEGKQYFYVIDSMGAIDSAEITIVMPESISASIISVDSVKCYGTFTGSVLFNITGGTQPYRNSVIGKLWQSGNISTGLSEGTFSFIFTDTNNCIADDTLSAYIPSPDTLQFENIEVVQSTCNNNNASIGVEMIGGSRPYSYLWNDYYGNIVGTTPLIDSLEQSGYYLLEVTDKNGCTQHYEQAINPSDGPSIVSISINNVKCFGDSTGSAKVLEIIPANPYAPWWLNWSNGSTADSAYGFPTGMHFVSVTDTNHCVFTNYFRITSPDSLWTSLDEYKDAHCFGYSDGYLKVGPHGGVGGYSYSWTNGDLTNISDSLSVGVYTVTLSDTNMCSNKNTYEVLQPDLVKVNLGDDIIICPNNQAILDGEDFSTYKWSTPQGIISNERYISIRSENYYYLEVTNDSGCYAYDTIHIRVGNDALQAYFLMTSAANYGDTLYIFELSNMELDSLTWEFDHEAFTDVTDVFAASYVLQLANSDAGIFNVKLRAYSGGCVSEAIKQVEIEYENDSVDDYFYGYKDPLISSFVISPNPNEGTFTANVGLRENADIELVIFSVNYGEIINDRFEYGLKDYTLDYSLTDLPSGVYIIILSAGTERKQVKMVIQ